MMNFQSHNPLPEGNKDMMNANTKRRIAALLSMTMLLSSLAPAALAEATISEASKDARAVVELVAPQTQTLKTAPADSVKKIQKLDKIDKIEKIDKLDKIDRLDKIDKLDKIDLVDKIDKIEKPEQTEAPAEPVVKPEITEKPVEPIVKPEITEKPIEPIVKPEITEKPIEPIVKPEVTEKPIAPVYSKIDALVSVDGDSITVTITEASSEAMYIAVGEDFAEGVYKGESRTFSGLAAGKYDIEVDYLNGTNVFRTSVTVEAADAGDDKDDDNTPPAQPEKPDDGKDDDNTPPAQPEKPDDNQDNKDDQDNEPDPIIPVTPPAQDDDKDDEGGSGSVTAPAAKQFEITPILSDGALSVNITGASDWELEVSLLDKNGKTIASAYRIGSGLAALGKFAAGEYTVLVSYVTPTDDASPRSASVTISEKDAGVEENTPQDSAKAISAKVSTGSDYIIVSIESASDLPMYVAVGNLEPKSIENGGSVRFSPLAPGKYDIEVDYVNPVSGLSPFRTTAEIREPDVLAPIKIESVTGGENKLSVTGTAEPGKEVSLSTTPATATTTVTADASGRFAAAITCEAGVYTAVSAQYSGNKDSKVTYKGTFTVTAPAKKPTLTVDEIYASSTAVSAKTTPGVTVELKTSDWTQKATADERGVVRFTLPHTYPKGTKITFTVFYGKNNAESFSVQVKVAEAPYYGLLKKGSKGDEVKKLTQRLKELGYPVSVKSKYDDSVVAAVRLFQAANGLSVDGMAGEKTQRALYSVSAIRYGEGAGYPTFVRGDRDHPMIYALQQRLKELGYYTIKVDGIFGSGTQRAVRDFQRVNGLTVTGKADSTTQRLLYSSAAKPNDGSSSGSYKTLTRSSKYQSAVVPLQRRLKALGYYSGSVDGYFGSQTYRAVRKFQSRNGLSVTGKADAYTQQVLYSSSAKAASGSSSGSSSSGSSSSTGYRLLYWGCEGSAVKKLQNALIAAGYKSIVRTADGIYGQWTYDAVRAYQKDHGLSVDGIAGKDTQNSLYGTHY